MKKGTLWIIIVVVVIVAIALFALGRNDPAAAPEPTTESGESEEDVAAVEATPRASGFSGEVIAGSEEASPLYDFVQADYEQALAGDKLVMLYFHANWCPTCKFEQATELHPAFNDITHDNVVGFEVNFNDSETDDFEKQLARDFGVTYQQAKVFIKDDKVIHQAPNVWSKEEYLETINGLI